MASMHLISESRVFSRILTLGTLGILTIAGCFYALPKYRLFIEASNYIPSPSRDKSRKPPCIHVVPPKLAGVELEAHHCSESGSNQSRPGQHPSNAEHQGGPAPPKTQLVCPNVQAPGSTSFQVPSSNHPLTRQRARQPKRRFSKPSSSKAQIQNFGDFVLAEALNEEGDQLPACRNPVRRMLKLFVSPSKDKALMDMRYRGLCSFLNSQEIKSIAESITLLEFSVPFNYDLPPNEGEELRYRKEFPNLRELIWSGPLGFGTLPPPLHDFNALPFANLRTLVFQNCQICESDCRNLLRSCPALRTFVARTVSDIAPLFRPICHEAVECPNLSFLEVKTSVDLDHFFSTLSANLEYISFRSTYPLNTETFPWNLSWDTLKSLTVEGYLDENVYGKLQSLTEAENVEFTYVNT